MTSSSQPAGGDAGPETPKTPILLAFCGFSAFYAIFFSSVVFDGKQFLSDGQFAAFHAEFTLWSDAWAGGWPAAADQTQMMFSPLRLLFRQLPYGFNLFVLSSYILASTFTFGYVHGLTRSRLAGAVSGLVAGLSGFMMAHLAHTGIISGVAWTPLLIWALDRLRHGYSALWLALGALAVAMMMLAGHPQMTAYGFLLGGAYALVVGVVARPDKWRYWIAVAGVFVLGLGLTAFQWLLAYELTQETFRASFSYVEFTSFSMPLRQLITLLFPFLFGSSFGLFFADADDYFGAQNVYELMGYAGASCVILGVIAVAARRDRVTVFWAVVAVAAVVLALGDSLSWIANVLFQIPGLNKFRVPGRHVYEYGLAIAVLSGLGAAALQGGAIGREKLKALTRGVAVSCVLLIFLAIFIYSTSPSPANAIGSFHVLSAKVPPAVYVPAAWMILTVLILSFLANGESMARRAWLIALMVAVEMTSFGWFFPWRLSGPGEYAFWHRERIDVYNDRVRKSHQKLINAGTALQVEGARLAGIPTLNFYGPLLLRRFSEATGINQFATLDMNAVAENHTGLDLFGGRYLFVDPPGGEMKTVLGRPWSKLPLSLVTGNGCGLRLPMEHTINFPVPVAADQLALVTQLGCSTNFADGQPVADVVVRGADGQQDSIVLRAGVDTAEWAVDCADVAPLMHHRRAAVFESEPVSRPGVPQCDSHTYLSLQPLTPKRVAAIDIKAYDQVSVNIRHITLSDSQSGGVHPVGYQEQYLPSRRWRLLETAEGVSVYENTRAMPRAWLVFDAIPLRPEQALATVRTSVLPDGRIFDPVRQALVEPGIVMAAASAGAQQEEGKASVDRRGEVKWEISAQSKSPSLLVVGQNYYPGWMAEVDGAPASLLRVNYAQQGVLLPAGDHKVVLKYQPAPLVWGLAISGISLIALILACWVELRRSRYPGRAQLGEVP